MRRLIPLALTTVALLVTSSLAATAATPPTRIMSCAGKALIRPAGLFVLACAEANALFRRTHWRSWTTTRAVGITDFGLNPCEPSCAASGISYFPHSRLELTGAKPSANGVLFTRVRVTYVIHGVTKTFVTALPTRTL